MEKLRKVIKESKIILLIILVLWMFLAIVLVAPTACAIAESTIEGQFNLNTFAV